jgi:hypothetical protein
VYRESEEPMLDLYRLIPDAMEQFDYELYHTGEERLIKPALEKLGYTNIRFSMGERDSFGPLSRIVHATNPEGQRIQIVYG